TPHRNLAGQVEVELKKYLNDKTNWRAMLTDKREGEPDLIPSKQGAVAKLPQELAQYVTQ
ncbi:MAG: DUF2797 domain-containing protein, partial [Salinivirgaceae bacterium]